MSKAEQPPARQDNDDYDTANDANEELLKRYGNVVAINVPLNGCYVETEPG